MLPLTQWSGTRQGGHVWPQEHALTLSSVFYYRFQAKILKIDNKKKTSNSMLRTCNDKFVGSIHVWIHLSGCSYVFPNNFQLFVKNHD